MVKILDFRIIMPALTPVPSLRRQTSGNKRSITHAFLLALVPQSDAYRLTRGLYTLTYP